jgi:hypothetical protein
VELDIFWSGTDVWVLASEDDLKGGDHRAAAAQISYFVKIKGKWRKHERIAAFDHTPNDGPVNRDWYKSRYTPRACLARACLSESGKRNTVDDRTCDSYR